MTLQGDSQEKTEKAEKRALAKLLYENDVLKPWFSCFPLPLAIFLWLPYVGLPLLDVLTDFYVIGTFEIHLDSKLLITLNNRAINTIFILVIERKIP